MPKISIENRSTHDESVTDTSGAVIAVVKAGETISFSLDTQDDLDRLTPYLVQLDAREEFDVDVR